MARDKWVCCKNSLASHVAAHVHLYIKIAMMVRSIFSFLFLGIYAYCQTGTAPVAAPAGSYDYSREAEVIRQVDTVYDYNADGTGDKTQTVSVLVQSDAAVRQLGVVTFSYAAQTEHPEIIYLRVRKKDGTVVETPPSDAQDLPSEVSRIAPFYSDLKEKQVPVKSLAPGDILEYKVHFPMDKPLAPGQFWGAESFLTNVVVLEQSVEIRSPKDKYLKVVSPKAAPVISEENGKKIYRWTTSHLEPTFEKNDKKKPQPSEPDTQPTIAWTTFKSWQEIGDWFGSLAKERSGPTAEIKAKAAELIRGKTTDDEKIQAIYDYVSTQVRYIGVAFGIGRYQPHAAETVMENQYGDCKDKHTLLASLLKAAGYDAWPALISDQMKLNPDLPSPAQFDHVITVVPRGNDVIWLDSTPEISPYRMLIYPLRDKQALVIATSGTATLMRTPKDPPFPSFVAFESNGKLDKDGTYTGHISLKMRGDTEIIYREIFHQTSRPQWNDVAQRISQNLGYAGTVSNLDVSSPERTTGAFQYSYDYIRKEYSDWANRRISPAMLPIAFPSADDDDKPTDAVLLGAPHVETMQSVIELPTDYTAVPPKSVKYSTGFATYQADYRMDGKKLIAERRMEILQSKVPVAKWEEYQKFVKNVQEDENRFIQLTAPGMEAAVEEEISNPDAERLIQEAFIDMQNNNFEAARSALDQAEKLNPRQLGLWMGYGSLQWRNNNMDDALANFKKEVSLHPGNPRVYRALAQIQMSYKKYDDAEASLRSLLKLVPNDDSAEMQLGNLLLQQKKYKEAAAVLTPAQKAAPDNKVLAIQAGRAQLFAGDRAAGEATLKSVLDGATEPGLLNDAAYELADAGLDLDLAESSCKKAIEKLESQTAQVSLTNLRNSDLGQINLLVATWDTMGWIYFREGNLPLAESYVRAAWMQGQHREVGDHLGQIYEKQGRKQEAANIYALAAASGRITPDPAGRTTMEDRMDRLKEQGIHASYPDPGRELGEQRSVYLPKLTKKYASAEFFIALSPDKVEDVQFIRGDEALKSAGDALRKSNFHMPFPKDSKAKLVRRGILACTPAMEKCQFTLLLPQTTTTQ